MAKGAQSQPLERLETLDVFRAVAVLSVFGFHVRPDLFPGGFVGVRAFFVLSGYLITNALLSERRRQGDNDWLRYARRRVARILPALVLVVLASLTYAFGWFDASHRKETLEQAAQTVLFSSNWFHASGHAPVLGLLGHCWSLGIEGQFYVLWPLVMAWGLLRIRNGLAALVCLLLALVAVGLRVLLAKSYGPWVYYSLPTNLDALSLGAAVAFAAGEGLLEPKGGLRHLLRLWPIGMVGFFAAVGLAHHDSPAYEGLWASLIVLGVALCVAGVVTGQLRCAQRGAVALGRVSYGFYLWHWPVILVMNPLRSDVGEPLGIAMEFVVSLLLSVGSYWLVEQPILRRVP